MRTVPDGRTDSAENKGPFPDKSGDQKSENVTFYPYIVISSCEIPKIVMSGYSIIFQTQRINERGLIIRPQILLKIKKTSKKKKKKKEK